ncbi:MAG: hypothetical protein BWX66_00541 [Deltaproteobacteria bacterium ADurb.Bin058]|jgi:hypothetical protein|nr:MAG: hypothetical protein BWX66_00541 [Deltaproteobacteria bacterium ADurb.Bin058]
MFYNCNEEIKRQSPTNIRNHNVLISRICSWIRDRISDRRQEQGQGGGLEQAAYVAFIVDVDAFGGWDLWQTWHDHYLA